MPTLISLQTSFEAFSCFISLSHQLLPILAPLSRVTYRQSAITIWSAEMWILLVDWLYNNASVQSTPVLTVTWHPQIAAHWAGKYPAVFFYKENTMSAIL